MKSQAVVILGVHVKYLRPPLQHRAIDRRNAEARAHYRVGMAKCQALLDRHCWDAAIAVELVRGPSHRPQYVRIRRAFARAATRLGFSSTMIGAALRRHHTSVLSLLK